MRTEEGRGPGLPGITAPAELRDEDLAYLRGLVHRETGIFLADGKRAFIAGRLARRLRQLGMTTYAEYCAHLRAAGDGEQTALFDALCIHETRFFREPAHFEFLAHTLLPRWRGAKTAAHRPRHLRIWSAGCSTGEEAYSLAMLLHSAVPDPLELKIEILATDLSTAALAVAQQGMYSLARVSELADGHRKAYMLRGRGRWEGWMRVDPELRALIRFERLNLHHTPYELGTGFDAIFCRNVLIYFDAPSRARVATELLSCLHRDGALFIGHAEGLHGTTVAARAIHPSVYIPLGREGKR